MRLSKRLLRSVIVVAAIVACAAGAPRLAFAQKRAINAGLAGQLRLISARMISGRFSAVCQVSNQSMTSNINTSDRRERMTINLAGGKPSLAYEASSSLERLVLTIEQGDTLTIRLDPTNETDGKSFYFSQGADGPIRLSIGEGKEVRELQAQSIWQLMIIEPEACREYLLPYLQMTRPGWQIKQQTDTIEDLLCRSPTDQTAAERAAWQEAVKSLASSRYAQRERAEQQLLDGGQRVLPLLQSLPRGELDAEQSFRVRRVVRQLTGDGVEDTPDRVAFWLAQDPRVWYALAGREDVAKRRAAAARLTRLLPSPVEFNPEGTAEERAAQLNRLREQHSETFNPPAPAKTTMNEPRQPAAGAKKHGGWGSGNFILDTF